MVKEFQDIRVRRVYISEILPSRLLQKWPTRAY